MSYLTGAAFEGNYKDGKRHGVGKQTNARGVVTYGVWENGTF